MSYLSQRIEYGGNEKSRVFVIGKSCQIRAYDEVEEKVVFAISFDEQTGKIIESSHCEYKNSIDRHPAHVENIAGQAQDELARGSSGSPVQNEN